MEYRHAVNSVNAKAIQEKYDRQLDKINDEITKLDGVIKNGCGSIIEKPATSRIKSNSFHSQIG